MVQKLRSFVYALVVFLSMSNWQSSYAMDSIFLIEDNSGRAGDEKLKNGSKAEGSSEEGFIAQQRIHVECEEILLESAHEPLVPASDVEYISADEQMPTELSFTTDVEVDGVVHSGGRRKRSVKKDNLVALKLVAAGGSALALAGTYLVSKFVYGAAQDSHQIRTGPFFIKLSDVQEVQMLTQNQVGYFETLVDHYVLGEGKTKKEPFDLELAKADFEQLLSYGALLNQDNPGSLLAEVFRKLETSELVRTLKMAEQLGMKKLLDPLVKVFCETIQSKRKAHFSKASTILEQAELSPVMESILSRIFYSEEQKNHFLSLLYTRTESVAPLSKSGFLVEEYFYTVAPEGDRLRFDLWDAQKRVKLFSYLLAEPLRSVVVSKEDELIIVTDRAACFVELLTGRIRKMVTARDLEGPGAFWGCAITPDKTLIAFGRGKDILLYHAGTFNLSLLQRVGGVVRDQGASLALSSDGLVLAEVRSSGEILLWDLVLRKQLGTVSLGSSARSVSLENKELLRTIDDRGVLREWSYQGEEVRSLELGAPLVCTDRLVDRCITYDGTDCYLVSLKRTPDGLLCEKRLIENNVRLRKVAFSPNEVFAVFMRSDGVIEIRDTFHWAIHACLHESKNIPQEMFFTATGEMLVGVFDRNFAFWHYFDARASYLKNPLSSLKALLYAHCHDLLSRDATTLQEIAPKLLLGVELGNQALREIIW